MYDWVVLGYQQVLHAPFRRTTKTPLANTRLVRLGPHLTSSRYKGLQLDPYLSIQCHDKTII